jgi:hypothetical protein
MPQWASVVALKAATEAKFKAYREFSSSCSTFFPLHARVCLLRFPVST